jgi:hypothetical protein
MIYETAEKKFTYVVRLSSFAVVVVWSALNWVGYEGGHAEEYRGWMTSTFGKAFRQHQGTFCRALVFLSMENPTK